MYKNNAVRIHDWRKEMKIAMLCNDGSSQASSRTELVNSCLKNDNDVYFFGVQEDTINDYYIKCSSGFIPIIASRNNINPLIEIESIFSVRKQIKSNEIDSVIIYGVKNHAAMAIGAKLGGAKKILCVVNGSGNLFRIGGLKGKMLRFMSFPMLKIAYGLSNSICFQNVDDKELFFQKRLITNEGKVFLTGGSGVNLDKFPHQELPKENRFLFLARITPSKGISEYIKAAEIVKEKYHEAVFDIVGPLDAAVENVEDGLLQKACDCGTVTYHGATTDVPGWIGKCRFFAYPSYYPEGVPRCAIQAIATGRPIITCDTPGCKETVKDGVNGFMIPAKNPQILAQKMIWMIEHPQEIERMAEESRKYAEEKFDVNKVNKLIIKNLSK